MIEQLELGLLRSAVRLPVTRFQVTTLGEEAAVTSVSMFNIIFYYYTTTVPSVL